MKTQRSMMFVCLAFVLSFILGIGVAAAAQGKELEKHPSDSKEALAAQHLAKSFPAPRQVDSARAVPAPNAPLLILYDQTDSPDLNGFVSQNFEAAYDVYDTQGADDFVVTGEGWVVTTVTTPGAYFNGPGPAASVHVTFYADAGGLPGAIVAGCDYPAITTFVDAAGSLTTTLPTPCTLSAGVNWVAVQVNMDFAVGGEWGWTMRDVQSGNPAVWQNPLGGFGTTCATYTARGTCDSTSATSPDNAFRLDGTTASCIVDGDCADGNLCNGVETCVAGVCTPGTPVNCDDGLFCTIDACTTSTGACTHAPNPCSDGDGCTVDTCNEATATCSHVSPPPIHLCNTGVVTIPLVGTATPYPSTIAVAGLPTSGSVCSVQLLGVTHTFPSDIDILLTGPGTAQNAIIMSDAGGSTAAVGVNLTLKDTAATSIPAPLVSGTYKPTNVGTGDAFAAPAPPPSGGSALSAFDGSNPNGNWNLYVVDDAGGDQGSLAGGWCVDIVANGCTTNSECNDGNLCNGVETCVAGTCMPGTPINCDDGQFCTIDSCDLLTGTCLHAANPCSDGVPCTTDTCDEGTDSCLHVDTCTQVCNPGSITINDSAAPPTIATPYPSSIIVAAGSGIFNLVSVQLLGLSHTFPGDIDILLAAPAGPNAIIMSDVGAGTDAVGVNLTLSDSAASPMSATDPLVSGTYQPTNAAGADAWPAPAPVPLGGSALSVFTGTAPNGSWDLYVDDDANIDSGSIAGGWCLSYRLTCTTAIDCNDGDPCTTDACVANACSHSPVGTPGLASGLTSDPDKQTITWSAAVNATKYDAVSGLLSALPVGPGGGDETCFPDLPSASLVDATVPGPGVGLWYLVRGDNDCTPGSYGTQSDGTPRVTTTCP